jgi:AcrR family transcriptional regulator
VNVNTNKHALRTERTRRQLEKAARALFEARGFAAVSAEELVAAAGVTRGALYHHYEGKEGLFAAVAEEKMRELHEAIRRKAASAQDPWTALELGARAFLDECSRPKVRQLLFVDAPAVLGWQAWREMDARYGLGMVEQALSAAMSPRSGGATMAAHVLVSALIEAAMLIARSADKAAARRDAELVIDSLLAALKTARS